MLRLRVTSLRPFDIRAVSHQDVGALVSLQIAYLHGSIVTQLGPRFLARFHQCALDHLATRAYLAADADGAVVGFVLGSIDAVAFNRHMKPRILLHLVAALLTPRRVPLLAPMLRGLTDASHGAHVQGELLLLVVDGRVRRQHVGRQLVSALERDFTHAGISGYQVAVRSQLGEARAFYLALGFREETELNVLGQPMTYLTKHLTP
jgi:ribosomal protein S18 acetylase RimI-like enzyme